MAYDPLTGKYTPDPVPTSGPIPNFKPYITTPSQPVTVGPVAPRKTATPGDFRRAEDASNVGAPAYTPTPLTETGEFATATNTPAMPVSSTTSTSSMNSSAPVDPYAQYLKDLKSQEGVSAYNLLFNEFNAFGLGTLVSDIKDLLINKTPASEMSLVLQQTPAYQARFSANKDRIAAGLRALKPSEYIALEDQYQNIMRSYGLPSTYWTKDPTGKQPGFDKFIANDVSASELENRIMTAQERVLKSNPEVLQTLKQFYPDITNGDVLAYALDPKNAIKDIQRKVSAAEIGGAALAAGLNAGISTAEELAGYGVSKAQAQQGFQTVADIAPRGSQLAEIYKQQPYGQQEAVSEVFGTAGATEATRRRKKLTELERAQFGGASGMARGALDRDRANNYGNPIQSGAGYF